MLNVTGQINAFIIPNHESEDFTHAYSDGLPVQKSDFTCLEKACSVLSIWPSNEIEVLKEGMEFSLCKHIELNKEIAIPNIFINRQGDKVTSENVSDYHLGISKGEEYSLTQEFNDRILAKKDGKIGWIIK